MRSLFLLGFCTLLQLVASAQDPEFTQFYNVPLYTNPAFAGSALNGLDGQNATRINLAYRNQWPNSRWNYQTVNASWDRHLTGIRGGIGGMLTRDVAGSGLISSSSLGIIYAPTFHINDFWTLRAGAQLGFTQRQLDFSQIWFANQIDPVTGDIILGSNQPLPSQSINFPNTALGAIFYHKRFHLGFAVHNLLEPNQSFFGSQNGTKARRYTVHGGAKYPVLKSKNYKSNINPYLLFMNQQNLSQINLSTNFNLGRLLVGTGLRYRLRTNNIYLDAAIATLGYKAKRVHFTYSFDLNTTTLRASSSNSHELSMNYFISLKKNLPDLELTSPSY